MATFDFDFDDLHGHVEESCIQFMDMFDGMRSCSLCYAQLPFSSQYDSHINGSNHCLKTNKMYEKLMDEFLSPGIVLYGDKIYCFLCKKYIAQRFDYKFRNHMKDYYHEKEVNNQKEALQEYEFDEYYDDLFDETDDYDFIFVEGVSRAGIRVITEPRVELYCEPCGCHLPGYSQFSSHVQGSTHLNWVVDQLKKLADRASISLGIVVKEGDFVCMLCWQKFTSIDNVYSHLDGSKYGYNEHDKKVQGQIDGGLYDSDSDDDDSD